MSLSNERVISLLNRYFVPVYLSNEDFRGNGSAPPEERKELQRIHQEGHAAKLSVGSVHAYVLGPDGKLLDSRHVVEAAKTPRLLEMLEGTVEKLGTRPGDPVAPPTRQAKVAVQPDHLQLHVTARYLEQRGTEYTLVRNAGGNWSAFPGEDWLSLAPEQWRGLLPRAKPEVGLTWEPDAATVAVLLHRFYPPTENNDLSKNRILSQTLRATVTRVENGIAQARLEGEFRIKHPFYHKDDDKRVEATVVGVLEFTADRRSVRKLELVTDHARYRGERDAGQPFGAVLRTLHAPR